MSLLESVPILICLKSHFFFKSKFINFVSVAPLFTTQLVKFKAIYKVTKYFVQHWKGQYFNEFSHLLRAK